METMNELQQKIVDKSGLPAAEVADLITSIRKETASLFGTLSPEEMEQRVKARTVAFFRKFISTPSDLVETLALLDSGIMWRNRKKIQDVLDTIGNDKMKRAEAVATGRVMESPTGPSGLLVIDQDILLKNGKPNPNKGKPLVEAPFRFVQGLFMDKDGTKKKFKLSLNSDEVKFDIPLRQALKMYTVRGKNIEADGSINLYLKTGTKPLPSAFVWDANKEADELFESRLLNIGVFDEAIDAVKANQTTNLFMIKGVVTNISLEKEKKSIKVQQGGGLDDVAAEIYVKIPDNLVDAANLIAPWSEVNVVGQIWKMPPFEVGGEELRAMTAQTLWSNETVIQAPPVSADSLTPQQADESEFQ